MANNYSAKGKITRLYPDSGGCYFKINQPAGSPSPMDGYYQLKLTHANYNSLYALLLSCVFWDREVSVRVDGNIDAGSYATVVYLFTDF